MKPLIGKTRGRIWELDALRGFAVLAMVFDHLTFDLSQMRFYFSDWYKAGGFITRLEEFGTSFQNSGLRFWGHYVFVTVFLLLVGISCTFSRSNVKRALQVLGCGLAVTAVTRFLVTINFLDMSIVWGILQQIGFGILLYATVSALWDNRYFMLGVGALIVLAGILIRWYDVPAAGRIPSDLSWWEQMVWFMKNDAASVLLGTRWYGPDHFGILPCAGVVLIGGYLGKTFYSGRRSLIPALDGGWNKPLRWVGRHAIIFYLAHQPVVMAAVLGIGLLGGLTLAI